MRKKKRDDGLDYMLEKRENKTEPCYFNEIEVREKERKRETAHFNSVL